MSRAVKAPIIVFGTGRSGTTIFHEIFACHENLAWLSSLCDSHPKRPHLNRRLMHFIDVPLIGAALKRRSGPSEAYPIWERSCPGFTNPCRDLVAEDVTPRAAARIRQTFGQMITGKRDRLLVKITGWPRLRYVLEIFPDAQFIHVHRDPRAVVSSLLEVPWWDGWRGPTSWRRGPLPPDLAALWQQQGESFVALAAIEYVIFERALQQCLPRIPPERMMDVPYGKLCADPIGTYRAVVDYCRLRWSPNFERQIRGFSLRDNDYKWRENLTPHQQSVLAETLENAGVRLT